MKTRVSILICALISIVCICCASCGKDIPEPEEVLKKEAGADIISMQCGDFDSDGEDEILALMGINEPDAVRSEMLGKDIYDAELWFYSNGEANKISDKSWTRTDEGIYEIDGQKFWVVEEYYESETVSRIFLLKNGAVTEANVSGKGGDFRLAENGDISLTFSDGDGFKDKDNGMLLGRTYKTYWFKWNDESERFDEYGGQLISKQEFLNFDGASQILELLKSSQFNVEEIYYYGNGKVAVNFNRGEHRYHITLDINDGAVNADVGSEIDKKEGYMMSSALPEYAVYSVRPGDKINEHYRIYTGITQKDYFCFYYDIIDLSGNVVKHECTNMNEPKIEEVGENILKVSVQTGTGRSTRWTYYYDIENNVCSSVYDYVLCETEKLFAYYKDFRIIIREKFNDNGYYTEIKPSEELSICTDPIFDAAFSEDAKSITITYVSGPDFHKITETIDVILP